MSGAHIGADVGEAEMQPFFLGDFANHGERGFEMWRRAGRSRGSQ